MKVIGVTGNILCYFYLNVWFESNRSSHREFFLKKVVPIIFAKLQNLRRILFNKSFNLLIKIYSVNLVIQSKYRKIRTRKNSVFWQFSRSVTFSKIYSLLFKQKTYIKNSRWSWNSADTAKASSNFQKKINTKSQNINLR